MKTIVYNSKLKDAIALAKEKGFFLGSGNPNAKILFVGKEAAIDLVKSSDQHRREITNNATDWESNFQNEKQFLDIDNWFKLPIYNPLYPYKGQKNTVESRNKEGKIVSGECGTSKTWYNYQKIIDSLFYYDKKSPIINFHELVFISELNQETGKYSHLVSKDKREASIADRTALFETSFFREFTITIVAVGHYVRDFNIDVENVFQMKFDEKLSKEYSEGLDREYINVHYDNLEKPTKLLIHTNQLSMVSTELIKRLGQVCKSFLEKKINT